MPKKIVISDHHQEMMRQLFSTVEYSIRGQRRRPKGTIKPIVRALNQAGLDLCEDTIRRHAVRMGLLEPVGAKYVPKQREPLWNRPCMKCRSKKLRPKGLYFCDSCRPT